MESNTGEAARYRHMVFNTTRLTKTVRPLTKTPSHFGKKGTILCCLPYEAKGAPKSALGSDERHHCSAITGFPARASSTVSTSSGSFE